jgi:hypothetical protein
VAYAAFGSSSLTSWHLDERAHHPIPSDDKHDQHRGREKVHHYTMTVVIGSLGCGFVVSEFALEGFFGIRRASIGRCVPVPRGMLARPKVDDVEAQFVSPLCKPSVRVGAAFDRKGITFRSRSTGDSEARLKMRCSSGRARFAAVPRDRLSSAAAPVERRSICFIVDIARPSEHGRPWDDVQMQTPRMWERLSIWEWADSERTVCFRRMDRRGENFPFGDRRFTSGAGIIKSRRGSRCAVSRGLETTSANMASMDKRRHQPASIACGLPPCFACPLRALLLDLGRKLACGLFYRRGSPGSRFSGTH